MNNYEPAEQNDCDDNCNGDYCDCDCDCDCHGPKWDIPSPSEMKILADGWRREAEEVQKLERELKLTKKEWSHTHFCDCDMVMDNNPFTGEIEIVELECRCYDKAMGFGKFENGVWKEFPGVTRW